jgi:DNA-binding MarR family transcriptional regulator
MVDPKREAQLNQALELLHFGFRAIVARPDELLKARGLTRLHHRILFFVRKAPDLSVNELCRTLGITKQALNAPLRQLLDQNLIESRLAASDRRIKQLCLTQAGAELEQQLSGYQRDQFEAIFTQVGAEAEADWREVMRLLASLLNA